LLKEQMLSLRPDFLIGQFEVMVDQKSQWEFFIEENGCQWQRDG
jgi:hypothetical protein